MKTFRLITAIAFAAVAATATADGLVGQSPSKLLKENAAFAKTYRTITKDQELPEWTQRLSIGFPAESVQVDGRTLILTSACNPDTGCHDERFYLLYDQAEKSITGFFFLPPELDSPGNNRMAFSRWLGKLPSKERGAFLLERAIRDAQDPAKDPAGLPPADQPAKTHSSSSH